MVVKVTRIGRSPSEVFSYAASTINDFLKGELEYTTDKTVKVSKSITPVYDPAKYPTWSRMPHARGKHGLLKASIKRKPVKQTKSTMKTAIYSRKRYSSYVEHGFIHHIAKRPIRSRKFIGVPMEVVHKRLFPRRITIAFKKAFKEV